MITYSIYRPLGNSCEILRLGFSVWARNPPKDYLSVYPRAAQEVRNEMESDAIFLCALVDDIWPRVMLSRTRQEQQNISDLYTSLLPDLGFHEVHLASGFMEETALGTYLSYATKITVSEFWKLLPQSKKDISNNLTLVEVVGFLWHIYVLENALNKFKLTGLLAGIRSEFFYLTARKLLPPHNVYFVNTS